MKRIVYACDIGSTKPKTNSFGWVRSDLTSNFAPVGSNIIDDLLYQIKIDLNDGASIALGFEAPQFMPVPKDSSELSCGRDGEGNRSMFAPAGGYVTTLSCHQTAFILSTISKFKSSHDLTLDAALWTDCEKPMILLWEAFVSGKQAHSSKGGHIPDAGTAAKFFHEKQKVLSGNSSVETGHDCFSFIGAVALWSGWINRISIIKEKCIVLRPKKKYSVKIPRYQRPR